MNVLSSDLKVHTLKHIFNWALFIWQTRGTTRSQPESGDAGDSINITDSALLSVSSLIDDDFESVAELGVDEKVSEEMQSKNVEFKNRYLWDVMEEDSNLED